MFTVYVGIYIPIVNVYIIMIFMYFSVIYIYLNLFLLYMYFIFKFQAQHLSLIVHCYVTPEITALIVIRSLFDVNAMN